MSNTQNNQNEVKNPRGGSSEQHAEAGKQSHKNDEKKHNEPGSHSSDHSERDER